MKAYLLLSLAIFLAGLNGLIISILMMMSGDLGAFGLAVVIGATTFPIAGAIFNRGRNPEGARDWLQREVIFK